MTDRIVQPGSPYVSGKLITYAETWSKWNDPSNKEGFDPTRLDDALFPKRVMLTWRNPEHLPVKAGVWGYGYVGYGLYDYYSAAGVTPVQVKALKALRITYSAELTNVAGTHGLAEFFLYSAAPKANAQNAKAAEIGWSWNCTANTLAFFLTGKQLGQFTDADGQVWQAASVSPGSAASYILFIPGDGRPRMSGSIDMLSALVWLKAKGLVQDTLWWSGVGFGIEPQFGPGALLVNDFSVTQN